MPALPNRALFENRSARPQPLKTGRPGVTTPRSLVEASAVNEAAGRLTREPPPASRQKLDLLRAHSRTVLGLKIAGRAGGASAPVGNVRSWWKLT